MKRTMHDMSPAEIAAGLKKAKALIDHPDKWVQHAFTHGDRICAHRAIQIAVDENVDKITALSIALTGMSSIFAQSNVCFLNNGNDHTELMARFDRAIAKQQRLSD